jgi:phospho-N-acetylmuramoyl-pentapeptide-transferase
MLYNLLAPYAHHSHAANLVTYISFRSGMAMLISLIISLITGPILIGYLRRMQKHGQPIRIDGPDTHFVKAGTPTMGGLMIIMPTLVSTLLLANLTNPYIWILLAVLILFGMLGLVDDYRKVSHNNSKGITGRTKIIGQLVVSLAAFVTITYFGDPAYASKLAFPFFKHLLIDLGYFYFPFAICVIIGASNAVNLTDGLDGLAVGSAIIAVSAFALITYLVGNSIYANYLQIIYVPQVGELTVLCAAIIGSSMGFLWYNAQPAEIFMGDTGSLALGGVLGTISNATSILL